MDLNGAKIVPAEGMLAVRFIDDDDDDDDTNLRSDYPSEPVPYEGCLATVVAVGAKVKDAKVGNIIVTKPYARGGLKIGDDVVLIEAWSIAATLKS